MADTNVSLGLMPGLEVRRITNEETISSGVPTEVSVQAPSGWRVIAGAAVAQKDGVTLSDATKYQFFDEPDEKYTAKFEHSTGDSPAVLGYVQATIMRVVGGEFDS